MGIGAGVWVRGNIHDISKIPERSREHRVALDTLWSLYLYETNTNSIVMNTSIAHS